MLGSLTSITVRLVTQQAQCNLSGANLFYWLVFFLNTNQFRFVNENILTNGVI